MNIIVEDGTGKSNANSYVSLEDFQSYAAVRNKGTVFDDDAMTLALVQAAEFIGSFESDFQGIRSSSTQALTFPRLNVEYNGYVIGPMDIPNAIKDVQKYAALASLNGVDLFPMQTEAALKRSTIGPITDEWDTSGFQPGATPIISYVNSLLKGFGYVSANGMKFKARRG